MDRVLVVGISGSGKTRFSAEMARILQVPVIHLDSIFWLADWVEEDPAVVEAAIRDALGRDRWVIEGYIEPLGGERVQRADLVLYLDVPGRTALLGGVQRWHRHRRVARPELPAGNTDGLGIDFLRLMWRRGERPEIEAALEGAPGDKVLRLRSRREARRYLRLLERSASSVPGGSR